MVSMLYNPTMKTLPPSYHELTDAELERRIAECKASLGERVCILGHHYQRDNVIAFADYRGDSLKLSQLASETSAEFIVFCGVHFMAESADILSSADQTVCLPNMQAGCAMAEMADATAMASAMDELSAMTDAPLLPVVYVNSTAAIKAQAGAAGGACCTSSNVKNVFAWALAQGPDVKIVALPDQHLARNTAVDMGYPLESVVVFDPLLPNGGLTAAQVSAARFICWKGHCYVHQLFSPEQIRAIRKADPEMRVVVHPECPREVVALADEAGSTAQIISMIDEAPAGSRWAVGTECHLVRRLAADHPEQTIVELSDTPAGCTQMGRVDLPHLLWSLDSIVAGEPVNVVRVDEKTATDARLSLDRMIQIPRVTQ